MKNWKYSNFMISNDKAVKYLISWKFLVAQVLIWSNRSTISEMPILHMNNIRRLIKNQNLFIKRLDSFHRLYRLWMKVVWIWPVDKILVLILTGTNLFPMPQEVRNVVTLDQDRIFCDPCLVMNCDSGGQFNHYEK